MDGFRGKELRNSTPVTARYNGGLKTAIPLMALIAATQIEEKAAFMGGLILHYPITESIWMHVAKAEQQNGPSDQKTHHPARPIPNYR